MPRLGRRSTAPSARSKPGSIAPAANSSNGCGCGACWRRNVMHCVRFEMRLNELLDERISPDTDRELLNHAEDCPDCAELLAGHELLLSGREWFEPTIVADFSVRVAAA